MCDGGWALLPVRSDEWRRMRDDSSAPKGRRDASPGQRPGLAANQETEAPTGRHDILSVHQQNQKTPHPNPLPARPGRGNKRSQA